MHTRRENTPDDFQYNELLNPWDPISEKLYKLCLRTGKGEIGKEFID